MSETKIHAGTYVLSYIGLLALTGATFGLSFVHLGGWEVPVALAIAFAKSFIVALFFMHLVEQPASHRIASAVAVVFVCILASLASADVFTRG